MSDDRGASERGDGKQHHMSGANPLRARKLRECARSFTYLRGSTRTITKHRSSLANDRAYTHYYNSSCLCSHPMFCARLPGTAVQSF
jgi:hypothetical protein